MSLALSLSGCLQIGFRKLFYWGHLLLLWKHPHMLLHLVSACKALCMSTTLCCISSNPTQAYCQAWLEPSSRHCHLPTHMQVYERPHLKTHTHTHTYVLAQVRIHACARINAGSQRTMHIDMIMLLFLVLDMCLHSIRGRGCRAAFASFCAVVATVTMGPPPSTTVLVQAAQAALLAALLQQGRSAQGLSRLQQPARTALCCRSGPACPRCSTSCHAHPLMTVRVWQQLRWVWACPRLPLAALLASHRPGLLGCLWLSPSCSTPRACKVAGSSLYCTRTQKGSSRFLLAYGDGCLTHASSDTP